MFKILNRIAWLISITLWLIIFLFLEMYWGAPFVFLFILTFLIKFIFLWDKFIQNNIWTLEEKQEENIIQKNEKQEDNITSSIDNKIESLIPEKVEEKEIYTKVSDLAIIKYIKSFFADNIMAKIWWILLALWIIFLMGLVYNLVGNIAKVIIGFLLWFLIYYIWTIVYKKWFNVEGSILLWTWLLINYIVILAGRFVIWEDTWILSSSITFLFLIFNTIFVVLNSYLYNSKNLLLFWIFFAYLIPFLTWSKWNDYSFLILVFYSVILTIGNIFISRKKFILDDILISKILLYFSIILWNLLILASPIKDNVSFFIQILWFNIITFLSIFLAYKNNFKKELYSLFIISFVYLFLIIFVWTISLWALFNSLFIFFIYFFTVIFFLFLVSFSSVLLLSSSIIYILFLPIILILLLLFTWKLFAFTFVIPLFLIVYFIIFLFLNSKNILLNSSKYIYFIILWIFLIFSNYNNFNISASLDLISFLSIAFSSFAFLLFSYYFSSKEGLTYLYSIWTLITIILLFPVLVIVWDLYKISFIVLILFAIINYITPFLNKYLILNDSKNFVLWNILWITFVGINLFRFWNEYFPWISLWLSFLLLAIIYFVWWYLSYNKISNSLDFKSNIKESEVNFIYTFLWIAISLFSASITIIFSNLPIIVCLILLIQSSILFFFYNKIKSQKILIAWIILFVLWILKYSSFLFWNNYDLIFRDFVWIIFIILSLFINIIYIKNNTNVSSFVIRLLHIIWMLLSYISLFTIFISNNTLISSQLLLSWWFIYSIIFFTIFGLIYNYIWDNYLKKFFSISLIILFLVQILKSEEVSNYNFNYLFTLISSIFILSEYLLFKNNKNNIIIFILYFFVASSLYLYNFVWDYFSLTIYWGILSLFLINLWIIKNLNNIRTIWLYLLSLTLLKIIFYDVWNSIDNPIIRVVAFILVWGIMIYISYLYSRNWLKIYDDFIIKKDNWGDNDYIINKKIKDIDVSNIESIRLNIIGKKSINIKSQNLFKIITFITSNFWKEEFISWELNDVYKYWLKNYKSNLNEKDYEKINSIIRNFVEYWWKIEIIKKD